MITRISSTTIKMPTRVTSPPLLGVGLAPQMLRQSLPHGFLLSPCSRPETCLSFPAFVDPESTTTSHASGYERAHLHLRLLDAECRRAGYPPASDGHLCRRFLPLSSRANSSWLSLRDLILDQLAMTKKVLVGHVPQCSLSCLAADLASTPSDCTEYPSDSPASKEPQHESESYVH